jgi:hypothetical protein
MNLLAATVLILVAATGSVACAQETRQQKQQQEGQQNQYRDQSQSLQQNQQQQDEQAYRGKISSKHGNYYLEVAYSRASYLLDDMWQARKFINKKVRVTGSLDADKSILHVISIAAIP